MPETFEDIGKVGARRGHDGDPMDGLSDEELMVRVGAGDHAAYAVLVDRHLGRCTGFAQRMLGTRHDGEEVAQEAFLRVWKQAPIWRQDGAKFTTWLYRVVLNLGIDRKRRPVQAPLEAAGDPPDPNADVAMNAERADQGRHMAVAVSRLPERQRAALTLCYYQEMSNAEAATVMGLTVKAVESLLVRARRTLRDDLKAVIKDVESVG
ncbi:MAG: RNA polymerase sigma factor [Alphaproteobacteria bacterium]|nr:RNA polymerase sigma factor [Alphaproteobacteria bacterium]